MIQFAADLLRFYSANPTGYGLIDPNGKWNEEKKKMEVTCSLKKESVTIQHWVEHINGEKSIGLAPLLNNGKVFWGAIDIDDYPYDLNLVVQSVWSYNLPLVPCHSKSGKVHLYAFFSQEEDAKEVRAFLKWVGVVLGCSEKVEVFPKQEKVDRLKFPSWINMPYFGKARCMIREDYTDGTLEEFIDRIKQMRCTLEEFKDVFSHLQVGDFTETINILEAPMCVATPLLLRTVPQGLRNHTMFAMGVYIKLFFQDQGYDVRDFVHNVNSIMDNPLPEDEVDRTIVASHSRASPFYSCENLKEGFCNEVFCKKGKYGKNTRVSSNITYGQLTQVMTDPPYYIWEIEGVNILFSSESEILGQRKVRELCARYLRKVPELAPEKAWQTILDKAFGSISIKNIEGLDEDFGEGARLVRGIGRFLYHTRRADNFDQILMKRVFHDTEKKKLLFLGEALWEYLHNVEKVTFDPSDLVIRLKGKGGSLTKQSNGSSVWSLPEKAFSETTLTLVQQTVAPMDISLQEDEETIEETKVSVDPQTFQDF